MPFGEEGRRIDLAASIRAVSHVSKPGEISDPRDFKIHKTLPTVQIRIRVFEHGRNRASDEQIDDLKRSSGAVEKRSVEGGGAVALELCPESLQEMGQRRDSLAAFLHRTSEA